MSGKESDITGLEYAVTELRATRDRLGEAERISGRGSWEWDIATGDVIWSDQMFRVFGLDIGSVEPSYEGYISRIHPEDRESAVRRISGTLETLNPWEDVKRALKGDGSEFLLATQGSVVADDEGRPLRMIGVCGDVTETIEAERARSQLAAVVSSSTDAIISQDLEGRFVSWSPGAEKLLGYRAEDMIGRFVGDVLPEEQAGENLAVLELIKSGSRENLFYDALRYHRDGTSLRLAVGCSPVLDASGELIGMSIIARDITEAKEAERQLREYADHDTLTGLINRRRFQEELERLLGTGNGGPSMGAVLVLDLDNFKYVNDAFGYLGSDELLTNVGRLLTDHVGEGGVVARLGGDEFGVLLPGVSGDGAVEVANQILKLLRGQTGLIEGSPISITTSIGVACFTNLGAEDSAALLADADRALYEAKDGGRDRYVSATSHDRPTAYESRLDWEERIRRALTDDGFVLYLQPIIDLSTRRVAKHEVLLRMRDDRGITAPGAFLGIAERHGLIHEIDRWVVGSALDLLEETDLSLAVNVSAQSLDDDQLLELLRTRLEQGTFDPGRLMIEVTETSAIVNIERAQKFAIALHRFGSSFALDDFGTGFGSFAYLKRIPAEYLKIDGEFVAPPRSHTDDCIIEVIVTLAKALKKKTIAEYVEDEATLEALIEAGVDYAQGFHIGRPGPVEDILRDGPGQMNGKETWTGKSS
ncbi:MAG TPA: EAL domain-containing protein [Solirubrobacterales bacterium]|nr:EAL domain-containing protein [Solirubrobacterales bacterium]